MLVELDLKDDERGFFARSFCREEFLAHGLKAAVSQCNVSWNRTKGTLRGLHYQASPHEEAKLVRCTRGAIWDVIVDVRRESDNYLRWYAAELTAENRHALYIPEGFAHGFQTLLDDSEVLYYMSDAYHPEAARGLRWNDPKLAIHWPLARPILSARDASYPMVV
jgi:dTDP-4-dehydrorhamnose 3,5-epimerase